MGDRDRLERLIGIAGMLTLRKEDRLAHKASRTCGLALFCFSAT
jgi:hypothetical protein